MGFDLNSRLSTRREILRTTVALAGGALLSQFELLGLARTATAGAPPGKPADDPIAASRARFGAIPIQKQPLAENITMLSGPGGNVVVLNGPDGKLVGDTFAMPAWPHFQEALSGISNAPVKLAIDTHWHFDHSDNNASLHGTGTTILAHENTKKRMSETNTLPVINMTFPPSPPDALPQQTFRDTHKIAMNGETISLVHVPPAHTDTDIYLFFEKANVLQAGDLYFNGTYPYIDSGTRGNLTGTIDALTKLLAVANEKTKIVPGHGPLGDKANVMKFRDMLTTVRERLQKLKSSGKSLDEAIAAKPLADLDKEWGQGLNDGDSFVKICYPAL